MSNIIESIDKNFVPVTIDGHEVVFHNVKDEPFQIYGSYNEDGYDDPFRRLPHLDGVNGGVNWLSYNTAGVRVRFTTDSQYIAIRVSIDGACHMSHMTLCGSCGFDMYELTDGKTNVAMGSVLKIWHRYRTEGIADPERAALPKMEELQAAAEHCSIDDLVIDREKKTVYLKDGEMSLDVGAVAKGYATQMVAEYIEEQGFSGFALSVGGNVKCIGERADGKKWEIGVQNPDLSAESAYFTKVYLTDQSLVTSGVYQRFYTVNGKEYHHIIDPDTLMPKREFASVSVITDHSGLADALSTALFNMTLEEGERLVESLEGTVAVWVYENGEVRRAKGFEKMEKQ